ncbi:histidine kinase dimerization/phosphoacceptor domain -containing protein [uncultured Methanobrevibacter sp.]|uniref:histidine kinase dimerization/phosphoacceptor domain -containing protein n=1 Tax=uncultured Methanobrevibacter sp. TaxID=253161 RepID=UPI0025CC54BD|nr:histidine kinase dimerization/phosphoacceptor domain -containing protein [uncultured Methanobrevibacter sp.]
MRIESTYRKLEDFDEVNIYDITEEELYTPAPQEYESFHTPFEKTLNHLSSDLDIFVPIDDGNDYIIHRLGLNFLISKKIKQSEIAGRLLSKVSPGLYQVLKEPFKEVYKTHETKFMRFNYHFNEKLARFSNVKVVYEEGKYDEKANLIEYFSQTGSYYKINDRYSWTQGVYNILNRSREQNDEYYNIIFDRVIPEDKPLIKKLLDELDHGRLNYDTIIRIKTEEGTLKYIEANLYSKFDEEGNLLSRYGLFKDVSTDSTRKVTRPVDFLLKGFKNSKKLALLIDPLSIKHYEFSGGFYDFIEEEPETYRHSTSIIENIAEKRVRNKIKEIMNGEKGELIEKATYYVHGDKNNKKIAEIYLERFEYGETSHSIGFITDITEESKKQQELIESYEHQSILIKEVHHRVKNNLQVLNSFLNLEKRAYKDQPGIIIDHMQSRLSSLAILHEKTYNTSDFKNINLKEYIVDQDSQLRSLIGMRDGIEFESEVDEDLNLTIEVITPLLLVIDELTMNAIKHAFPDKSVPNKKIIKKITRLDDNTAQLIHKDNGVGIADPSSITKNLGCEIIKNLTKQLDGKIELFQKDNGVGYRLTFPISMEHTIE